MPPVPPVITTVRSLVPGLAAALSAVFVEASILF
jgi:hypothetical protein